MQDYPDYEVTWEPESHLKNMKVAMAKFKDQASENFPVDKALAFVTSILQSQPEIEGYAYIKFPMRLDILCHRTATQHQNLPFFRCNECEMTSHRTISTQDQVK